MMDDIWKLSDQMYGGCGYFVYTEILDAHTK
jgi:hypothetical protein